MAIVVLLAAIAVATLAIGTDNARALSIGTYDQCSNDDGDGYASGDTGCRWINGNLNANNSTYQEGDATVQRLWLKDFAPGSTHTVTFQYGTTKGGKHAYDYLTQWNYSEGWITDADRCQGITGCLDWPESSFPIPVDPNPAFAAEDPDVAQPAGRVMTIRNGSISAITTPAVVSGSYAGDSETAITVTFTVGADADACSTKRGVTTCSVAFWFGAHVALTGEWASGGAGTVSGSPYHVSLAQVDGASVGERDNQMQSGAVIIEPTITTQVSLAQISLGQSVTDTATFSGQAGAVTGTATFFVCGPAASPPDCTTGGSQVGGAVTISQGTATSAPLTPTAPGTYCFRVDYAPDATARYLASSHTNTDTECFAVIGAPGITVDKTVNPTTVPETGGSVTYTYVVNNSGDVPVTITSLSDDQLGTLAGDGDCQVGTALAVSGSCTFDVAANIAAGAADSSVTNIFTAHAVDAQSNDVSDADDAVVTRSDVLPAISVDKTVAPTSVPETGGTVDYHFVVTNTGSVAVTITSLVDDQLGSLAGDADCQLGTVLAAGASCDFDVLDVTIDAGAVGTSHDNIFTACADDAEGNDACDDDPASVTRSDVLPAISLVKSVSPGSRPEPGGDFIYTLTITNTSTVAVTITSLTDDNALSAECVALIGTSLAPGASASCTYTVTYTDAGTFPNTANACAEDAEGNEACDSDDETVTVTDVLPTVTLVKTASPTSLPEPGGVFTYTLTITNNSVEIVAITSLNDDNALSAECLALLGDPLAANGGQASCTYTVTNTNAGTYPNTPASASKMMKATRPVMATTRRSPSPMSCRRLPSPKRQTRPRLWRRAARSRSQWQSATIRRSRP